MTKDGWMALTAGEKKQPYKTIACHWICVCVQMSWQYPIYKFEAEKVVWKFLVLTQVQKCKCAHKMSNWSIIDHRSSSSSLMRMLELERVRILFMGVIMLALTNHHQFDLLVCHFSIIKFNKFNKFNLPLSTITNGPRFFKFVSTNEMIE